MLKRYRLQLAVAAAVVPGAAALGWTAVELVDGNWRPTLAWFAVLAAATVAEAIPVPIPRVSAGTTSLATVFLAAGAVKLGPEAAASAAALAILIAHSRREQPFVRRVYNTTLYGLAGFTAGYICLALPEQLRIGVLAATAFYLVDVGLLTFVIAATTAERWISTAQTMFKTTF